MLERRTYSGARTNEFAIIRAVMILSFVMRVLWWKKKVVVLSALNLLEEEVETDGGVRIQGEGFWGIWWELTVMRSSQ